MTKNRKALSSITKDTVCDLPVSEEFSVLIPSWPLNTKPQSQENSSLNDILNKMLHL